GAQVDRFGNINTTVIGAYDRPMVRLPGAGGAPEIAVHARRTLVMSRLSKRAFPESVDFITSPGHSCRGRSRKELGIPGAGPVKVITDKAILEPDERGELVLAALYPGVAFDEVAREVGWRLRARDALDVLSPPTEEELSRLREIQAPVRRPSST
ncbi:MAG TPA: CoA-transferase, partial [Gemmatimonadaceae bacterium]|nr:CoA-transferase [Gemmatimonadaceae bacterium]